MKMHCVRAFFLLRLAVQVVCAYAWCAAACSETATQQTIVLLVPAAAAAVCVPIWAEHSLAASWQLAWPRLQCEPEAKARNWLCCELPLFIMTFTLACAMIIARPLPYDASWTHLTIVNCALCALGPTCAVAAALAHASNHARDDDGAANFIDDPLLVEQRRDDGLLGIPTDC